MKLIIAGSRTITNYATVEAGVLEMLETIHETSWPTEIVSGTAPGVDRLGEIFAKRHDIPIRYMPADWKKNGPAAGPIRNAQMAEYADALLAVWDGHSPGTKDMIQQATRRKLLVSVKTITP